MKPSYPAEAEAFRTTIRTFLHENLPEGWAGVGALPTDSVIDFQLAWRRTLHEHGYLAPSWPAELGGGGLSHLETVILVEEFARAGVPTGGPNDIFNVGMIGNTILHWGTEEQRRHYIPKLLSNEHIWCQGFSEPDAGSDLASLACRATLDGDEWVLSGQKIWTTYGHFANHIFVLARTDLGAPLHRGLTFLLVPMEQPGIEVRGIEMISGESEFNEVFFSDARCPRANVLGEVNGGWAVAMTLLGFERGEASAVLSIRFAEELDRLIDLARQRGRTDDPVVRDRLARAYGRVQIMRYLGMRTLTSFLAGGEPGADAAITKLYWSEYHQFVTEFAVDLLGAGAIAPSGRWPSTALQTDDPGAPPDSSSWVGTFYNARAGTIYAGTSEIQRNIIGERLLGLPKEPRP